MWQVALSLLLLSRTGGVNKMKKLQGQDEESEITNL